MELGLVQTTWIVILIAGIGGIFVVIQHVSLLLD